MCCTGNPRMVLGVVSWSGLPMCCAWNLIRSFDGPRVVFDCSGMAPRNLKANASNTVRTGDLL